MHGVVKVKLVYIGLQHSSQLHMTLKIYPDTSLNVLLKQQNTVNM
jgi:hypothetical protein